MTPSFLRIKVNISSSGSQGDSFANRFISPAGQRKGRADTRPSLVAVSLLQIDTVENMAAERINLKIDYFLSNRFEDDRMSNGGPWSLLFENHLSLLIELGALCRVGDDLGFLESGHQTAGSTTCARFAPPTASQPSRTARKLSGSPLSPVQPSRTAPSRSFSLERFRYSAHS